MNNKQIVIVIIAEVAIAFLILPSIVVSQGEQYDSVAYVKLSGTSDNGNLTDGKTYLYMTVSGFPTDTLSGNKEIYYQDKTIVDSDKFNNWDNKVVNSVRNKALNVYNVNITKITYVETKQQIYP